MNDDLRAKAEAAKAWTPLGCQGDWMGDPEVATKTVDCNVCDRCLGAQRAVEDIAEHVDDAMRNAKNNSVRPDRPWREAAVRSSDRAARIASYFCSEPNPVSIFRDAVKEACK